MQLRSGEEITNKASTSVDLTFVCRLEEARCDGCRACLPACSHGALVWVQTERTLLIDPWACTGCGTCVTACPQGALRLTSRGAA